MVFWHTSSMNEVIIRNYQPEDAHSLANIYYTTIHKINSKDYDLKQIQAWAPKRSCEAKYWLKKWQQLAPLVAVKDNKIVGFAEFETTGHIDCFYIHHEYLGQGIGKALMEKIKYIACGNAIDRVYAEVSISAKDFFTSCGFKVIREQFATISGIKLKQFKMEKHFVHQNRNIALSPYNPNWPQLAKNLMQDIKNCLQGHCLELHHFGSTSIPGLCAKDKIDLICVIDNLNNSLKLEEIGYEFRGEWNIPLRYGFAKRSPGIKANLHVVELRNGFVDLNLHLRDYLRNSKSARDNYAKVKTDILDDPNMHLRESSGLNFPKYTLAKNDFITSLLLKSNYDGWHVNFCAHENEWNEYFSIFNRYISSYDICSYKNLNGHYHFVLYKVTKIIGAAHVEQTSSDSTRLRFLKNLEDKELLLNTIQRWHVLHSLVMSR